MVLEISKALNELSQGLATHCVGYTRGSRLSWCPVGSGRATGQCFLLFKILMVFEKMSQKPSNFPKKQEISLKNLQKFELGSQKL